MPEDPLDPASAIRDPSLPAPTNPRAKGKVKALHKRQISEAFSRAERRLLGHPLQRQLRQEPAKVRVHASQNLVISQHHEIAQAVNSTVSCVDDCEQRHLVAPDPHLSLVGVADFDGWPKPR